MGRVLGRFKTSRAILKGFAPHFHVLYREIPFLAQASLSTALRSHLLLNITPFYSCLRIYQYVMSFLLKQE